jgi:hypothetical protein
MPLFPASFASDHTRMIHNVWHSTSVQPFYLCCDSGRADVPNYGWNCQLTVGDNQPIPHSLAIILGHLMGNDAAGRRASGSHDSIRFFSSDKRVAPNSGVAVASKRPLWVKGRPSGLSATSPFIPRYRTFYDAGRPAASDQKLTSTNLPRRPYELARRISP